MHESAEWQPRKIEQEAIARVEGEGALEIAVSDGQIRKVKLRIYEPPRFFEGFLINRKYDELPDITARICGICPISYQMASCTAVESAFNFVPTEQTATLRRLFSWAEIMQNHALQVYLMAGPDYFHLDGADSLAKEHPEVVKRGLKLKRAANNLSVMIGGREVHPIGTKITGFYDVPTKEKIKKVKAELEEVRPLAVETLKMVAKFDLPEFERPSDYLALSNGEVYALNEGEVKTLSGDSFPVAHFLSKIDEYQVDYSNALRCHLKGGGPYQTGPLARVNINYQFLSSETKSLLREFGFNFPSNNPFYGIVARAAELLTGIDDCLALLADFTPAYEEAEIQPRASLGAGISEAPRGSLFHQYSFNEKGLIKTARIIPPTEQNLERMEADLKLLVAENLQLNDADLTLLCEMLIRSYDPCISCATHFLKVTFTACH